MTQVRAGNIFRMRGVSAIVTATVCAAASLLTWYTVVRCPWCERRVMEVPGEPMVQVRNVGPHRASGRGRVVACRCGRRLEVVEHA